MSTVLEVSPTQWSELKRLGEVEPLNSSDLTCMAEVREVLKKHGKRERFGIALLHKHFDLDDSELLLENSDESTRELTIKPVRRDETDYSVPTIWALMDEENRVVQACGGRDVDAPQCR